MSLSTHFFVILFVLPNCLFLPSHWTQWENQEASTLFFMNDEMNTDAFVVLNGLESDNDHASSFVFIDLAPHSLFHSIFLVDSIVAKTLTDLFFPFFLTSYFLSSILQIDIFSQKTTTEMTKYWAFFFQPAVNREAKFLDQFFNTSFEHIKLCLWRFTLISTCFTFVLSFLPKTSENIYIKGLYQISPITWVLPFNALPTLLKGGVKHLFNCALCLWLRTNSFSLLI